MANKIPAGRWRLRPYDPKCKTFVDADRTVEDQIRCRVPLWSGNFDELKPELISQGLALADLPSLTVHDIGQFVIRAVQGGPLRAGAVGTAAHTIVHVDAPPVKSGDEEWAEMNLSKTHWRILEVCCAREWTDRATAKSADEITAFVGGNGGRPARGEVGDLRRYFDLLSDRGFLKGRPGVGSWITPRGLVVLKARQASRSQLPRIVS